MLDLKNDHLIFDGVETVVAIQAGTSIKQIINHALQFGVTSRDLIGSDGTYRQGDVKFNLPAVECPNFLPDAGDFIEQADHTLWSVGMVERLTLKTRHQVWCKRVALNPNTAVALKVYRETVGKDTTGAAFSSFKLWKETTGHINELASVVEATDNRRRLKITHQIFIAEQLDVQAGMKVVDQNGNTWLVERVTGKGSLGKAVVMDVQKSRTPLI